MLRLFPIFFTSKPTISLLQDRFELCPSVLLLPTLLLLIRPDRRGRKIPLCLTPTILPTHVKNLMAPLPLAYGPAAPTLIGPASTVVDDDLTEWRRRGNPTPTLIVNLCGLFEISPSQLNPPAWRILIAIQNQGDLEYLSFGLNEVLFAYHLAPLNGGEGRFHLRPRSGLPIVEELPKNDRKGPAWGADRSLILNRFSDHYILSAAGTHHAPAEGNMSGSAINDPFATYQEVAKMMSAKKGSASRTTSGDEVIITGSRRATMAKPEPTSSSQGKKSKVFPQDGVVLPAGDPSEVVQVLQGGLLQVTSQLYHLKERISNENLVIDREELKSLKRQVSEEREQCVARELEICDLKDKVRELKKVAETSSADALAASQKSQELEEEVEILKLEMVMAVNGARIVARWELMREWLNKQSSQWDLNRALDQYKMVILEEAKNKGDPPPSFEDDPAIPPAS
ncbi:hypothetical protein F2Q68_00038996 [Brassica cretica]|nr:hypothetical protein F2Q68_00038996 [Brassica cretica]